MAHCYSPSSQVPSLRPAVSWHMQVTYLLFDGERQSLKGLPF
ncbi:hypothetical protein AGR7C_Cc110294 [Agrobacterium deltaense Zutra 3/1]|uniref:Uncharacterized protein n=1 Tax=Agrobacterium deltaense Zutra 3/1 TaxID=1183427 RepID=A0A1S7P3Q2_9HYPH|nr:hypothetical protein AGR7C_Cc110294 [Agrobacterium deltaense Zutra 3/1]